jgi:hypothetical protein
MNRSHAYRAARVLAVVLLVLGGARAMADVFEWPVFGGGNGHFYELKQPPGGINWTNANTAAQASTFRGVNGHLATVTSAAENNFIISRMAGWAWIGLSDAAVPGTYAWVTGEPFSYTNWEQGQPTQNGEHYVHYSDALGSWRWNDLTNVTAYPGPQPLGYLVEYPLPVNPNRVVVKKINTGFNNGAQLANGAVDTNYTVLQSGANPANPKAQSSPLPGTWLADNASTQSRWIVLTGSGSEGISVAAGNFTYRTTVDLTGYNPTTAEIAGLQLAADDSVVSVAVNGGTVYTPPANGFGAFQFEPNIGLGAFHDGLNTIDFLVPNSSFSPVGLRLEGAVAAVAPEPGLVGVLAAVVGLLGCVRRRSPSPLTW